MLLGLGRNVFLLLSDEHSDTTPQPFSVGSENSSLLASD